MSVDATRWAWSQQITATQKLVLLSLADRADENNLCYPSTKRLESDTGLYRETIFEAIKKMEEMHLLTVKRELGKGNRFTLNGVLNRHQTSSDLPTSSKKHTSREMPTPTSREMPTTQSVNADTYQSANADTEPNNEPKTNLSIEPIQNKQKKSTELDLLKNINTQVAIDFIAIRKAKNLPVTKTALSGIEREAKKLNYSLEEALTICCERGWGGFNSSWILKENSQVSGKSLVSKADFQQSTTDAAYEKLFGSQLTERDISHEAIRV